MATTQAEPSVTSAVLPRIRVMPHTHIKSRTHIRASHVCRHTPMMTVPSAAESQNLSDVTHTHRVTKTYTSESFMQTFKYDGDSSICR